MTENQQLACCISKINTTGIQCQMFYATQIYLNVYENKKELTVHVVSVPGVACLYAHLESFYQFVWKGISPQLSATFREGILRAHIY
jgi:hypothetical protein